MATFDPAILIRIARGLSEDAQVHVNPAHAEALRRVAEYVWLEVAAPLIRDSWGVEHEDWCGCDDENRHFSNPYTKEEA